MAISGVSTPTSCYNYFYRVFRDVAHVGVVGLSAWPANISISSPKILGGVPAFRTRSKETSLIYIKTTPYDILSSHHKPEKEHTPLPVWLVGEACL